MPYSQEQLERDREEIERTRRRIKGLITAKKFITVYQKRKRTVEKFLLPYRSFIPTFKVVRRI